MTEQEFQKIEPGEFLVFEDKYLYNSNEEDLKKNKVILKVEDKNIYNKFHNFIYKETALLEKDIYIKEENWLKISIEDPNIFNLRIANNEEIKKFLEIEKNNNKK